MSNVLYRLEARGTEFGVSIRAVASLSKQHRFVVAQRVMSHAEYSRFLAEDELSDMLAGIVPVRPEPG